MTQLDFHAALAPAIPVSPDAEHAALDRIAARIAQPRRRRNPRRIRVGATVAFAMLLICGIAAANPAIRHALWDEEAQGPIGQVTDPGGHASSEVAVSRFATESTDPKDRAAIEGIVTGLDPTTVPHLVAGTPVQVVNGRHSKLRLVYMESTNGGFCFILTGGDIGSGGCLREFGNSGIASSGGYVGGEFVNSGIVATDVTKLELERTSGTVEEIDIDHGLFTWSEDVATAQRDLPVAVISTRAGKRIRSETSYAQVLTAVAKMKAGKPGAASRH